MKRRLVILLLACALLAVGAAAPTVFASGRQQTTAAGTRATGAVTFGSPYVVDPVHTYGEPDIRIAFDGSVYDSGPWGTGTQRSIWEQSLDGGRTFHVLHDQKIGSAQQSDSTISGPGGGDTEISVDRSNRVYYADLAALETLKVARWDKATRTMDVKTLNSPQTFTNGVDRQWFAVWDPPPSQVSAVRAATGYTGPLPVNYLIYDQATGGDVPCSTNACEAARYSTDGVDYVAAATTVLPIQNDGPVVIDQQTGTVLQAISVDNSNFQDVGVGIYSRASSNSPTDPGLTQSKKIKIGHVPGDRGTRALFPVIAMDTNRTAYVVWTSRDNNKSSKQDPSLWQIYYSYATAASNWANWSAPVKLTRPPSNTNVMPWVTAGAKGRMAAVWYGTNDNTHNPSTEDVHQAWNVYLADVTNADSPNPSIKQIRVTRHPMHYGSICLQGAGCAAQSPPGNRNMADFFQDQIDPRTGALWITYNDTSNNLKQHDPSGSQGAPEDVAHFGAPVVMAVEQNGGVGLLGKPVRGPSAFGSTLADPKGDAVFDPIYGTTRIPQLDLRSFRVKRTSKNLVVTLKVSSLSNLGNALSATGAGAVDFVARWIGGQTKTDQGLSYPIYYAAAETTGGSSLNAFAGMARSVELCSVSGCDPHIIEYPEPPYGGTSAKDRVRITKGPRPDVLVITVPLKSVGSPMLGALLQSFAVYSFARNKPANIPITNSEAQGGITPIEIDGICCKDVQLRR